VPHKETADSVVWLNTYWRSQAVTGSIGAVWLGNQKSELRSQKTENRIHLTSDFWLLNWQPVRRGYDSTELAVARPSWPCFHGLEARATKYPD